jgi:hypothetical protein
MFLTLNPGKGRTEDEKRELEKKYKVGENVIPRVEEREKSLRERRRDDEDRRLVDEVRSASLLDVGPGLGDARNGRRRAQSAQRSREASRESRNESTGAGTDTERRERRRRERGADSETEGAARRAPRSDAEPIGTNLRPETSATTERRRRRSNEERRRQEDRERNDERSRGAARQIEHQPSLRSLISSSDVDSRDMEEEILRQIREEGLLDGIDLENIDVNQEDEISERIAEAFRRRQRERAAATSATSTGMNTPAGNGDRSVSEGPRTPNNSLAPTPASDTRHQRSLSATNQPVERTRISPRSSPWSSASHLEVNSSDSEGRRRRRTSSGARSATSPAPPPSMGVIRPASRSQTDVTERPRSSRQSRPPSVTTETRSSTEPTPERPAMTEAAPAEPRRQAPELPPRANVARAEAITSTEVTHSPVEVLTSNTRAPPPAAITVPTSVPTTASSYLGDASSLMPAPLSPRHPPHSTATERATAIQSASRPNSSGSTDSSGRISLPRYPEPSISCSRCFKAHIEYELHYNCAICSSGDWNTCLSCYRTSRGCLYWFGFGNAAWTKYNRLKALRQLPEHAAPPHMLYAERYVPPKIIPGGADGRRTLTTEDPQKRLQAGAFCAGCLVWANECYWRCESCNEGDWGFCNSCVNTGKCCSHPLLPLLYNPKATNTPPQSPTHEASTPTSATLLEGPNVIEFGSFKPLSFRPECKVCKYPIQPSQTRFHCFVCNEGDYDVCTSCYHSLIAKKRISPENGHNGWRRCLQGHRMIIIGFDDSRGGQRRVMVQDLVGGRALQEEPAKVIPASAAQAPDAELQTWSWADKKCSKLVTTDVAKSVQMQAGPSVPLPPDGGTGMRAVAKWNWWPAEEAEDELPFPRGAEMCECVDVNGDWFWGVYMGRKGLFPAPYVKVVDVGERS